MGVVQYGGVDAARQFVASPEASKHVVGEAVDIAPVDADKWLIRNGSRFGLCQIFANEIWHFELAVDEQGRCPPLKPNAAG
jgi:zinc D-Ala-D-Ala carboxypeptidase